MFETFLWKESGGKLGHTHIIMRPK